MRGSRHLSTALQQVPAARAYFSRPKKPSPELQEACHRIVNGPLTLHKYRGRYTGWVSHSCIASIAISRDILEGKTSVTIKTPPDTPGSPGPKTSPVFGFIEDIPGLAYLYPGEAPRPGLIPEHWTLSDDPLPDQPPRSFPSLPTHRPPIPIHYDS